MNGSTFQIGTLPEALASRSRNSPAKYALHFEQTSLTWEELLMEAMAMAEALREAGATPGSYVATWGTSAPLHVVSLLACGMIEAIQLPLNPRWQFSFLKETARRSAVIITDGRLSWPDTTLMPNFLSWSGRTRSKPTGAEPIAPEAGENTPVAVNWGRDRPGHPQRGCLLTHKMILANASATAQAMELTSKDSVAYLLPAWQHPHELIGKGLVTGTPAVVVDFPYPRTALSVLGQYSPTWMIAAPRVAEGMLPFGDRMTSAFRSLRAILLFGDYPRPKLLNRLEATAKAELFNGWGSAETSGVALMGRVTSDHSDNCGFTCPGYEASVRSDSGAKDGELLIRGNGVALSYLDKKPVTGAGGWLATGDIVRITKDGELRLLGRPGEAWLRGGKRVAITQIEASLSRVPGVKDTAVLLPQKHKGSVNIYIEPGEGMIPLAVLNRKLKQLFGNEDLPSVNFLSCLPRLPDGSLDKITLLEGRGSDLSLDAADRAILDLINRRAAATPRGKVRDLRPLSADEAVLRTVVGNNPGPLYDDSVEEIFRCILDHCKRTS